MRTIKYVSRFKRDYRRRRSGKHGDAVDVELMHVVDKLARDEALPRKNFDHALSGEWSAYRDCHIRPDLILIYKKNGSDVLELVRLGSHSELGC